MTITLAEIKSDHARLADKIVAFERAQPRIVNLQHTAIALAEGETYAGLILNEDGTLSHHLVLLAAKPEDDLDWEDAKTWAATVNGWLPDRQEAALIYANCKSHVDARWHWTSEQYESNASYAWSCDFTSGGQFCSNVSSAGAARAVRRLKP